VKLLQWDGVVLLLGNFWCIISGSHVLASFGHLRMFYIL
jgi:hypothetical protein